MFAFIRFLFLLLLAVHGTGAVAQTTRRVLFLGNSYTGVNDLPELVKDVALSAGDTLIFDNHNPGGYALVGHATDPTSQAKIMAGGWHYVVLQGQSQEPIIQPSVFSQGGRALETLITQYNTCAVTMLYMTWGRKNGDPVNCEEFPVMCTYQEMDSALRKQYLSLAGDIDAEVSPVSAVWRYLRQNHAEIELYQGDGSHPSAAGSYAAACCFYTSIFKKDPTLITFDFGLSATVASAIRNAAKTEVFDHLDTWDYKQLPWSDFRYEVNDGDLNQVIFSPVSHGVSQTYSWNFGDGDTSAFTNPVHAYASNGTYTVELTTTNCDLEGVHTDVSDTVIRFCDHTPVIGTSHPWLCNYDTLWTQSADVYQWYSGGSPIPETGQFLPNYQQYSGMGFTVMATTNGCAELSKVFYASPQWSGYYFDAAYGGDPCEGDTAIFAVLHTNGTLSGTEIIHWFKNGVLLPSATNEDTLLITTGGAYECKVINPASDCPLDTTASSQVLFDCETVGSGTGTPKVSWRLYPNPAGDFITVEFNEHHECSGIEIYDATGSLVKAADAASATKINVADLPGGLYYIRLKNNPQPALKLIRQ